MTAPVDIWATTAVKESGVTTEAMAAAAVELRGDILQMTQAAEDAVLRPTDPGRWSHELRAALACRIARLNGSDQLAAKYLAMVDTARLASVANPDTANDFEDLSPCLTFTDRVATNPGDVAAEDIQILQDAAVSDADIVRLTELIAFLGYQVRLVAGLSLLAGMSQ